jgi:hypothetical protein
LGDDEKDEQQSDVLDDVCWSGRVLSEKLDKKRQILPTAC